MLLSQLTEKQIQLITNEVFVEADVFVHQEEGEQGEQGEQQGGKKENKNNKEEQEEQEEPATTATIPRRAYHQAV